MRLKLFICLLAASFLSQNLSAEINARYATIPDRNAFGLNQKQIEIVDPPPPLLPNVKLTGISQVNGETTAYFIITGQAPNESPRYVSLRAGESDDFLELRKILKTEGEVHIRNTGAERILKLGAEPPPKVERLIPLRAAPKF